MRYLVGILGFPLGLIVVVYRERIKNFIGDIPMAERYLGAGGTYTAILIFGLLISIGSIMFALGTFQMLFLGLFGPILGTSRLE